MRVLHLGLSSMCAPVSAKGNLINVIMIMAGKCVEEKEFYLSLQASTKFSR